MKAGRHSFETLNLLRGIAALAVLVLHFPGTDQRAYWSGYLSVDLFFLLSGVVVAHAYDGRLREGWRLHRFLIARWIRLWPLYLLGSAIGAIADAHDTLRYGHEGWRVKLLIVDLLRGALLWPASGPGVAFRLDPPAWSLFCELAINVVYGALLVRWRSRWILALALAGAAALVPGAERYRSLDVGVNLGGLGVHLWVGLARASFSFPVGILIYRGWAAGRLPRLVVRPEIIALAFLGLLACPGEGWWGVPGALAIILVGFPLLIVAATQVEPSGPLRRAAQVTADISYPIYVLHWPIFLVAGIAVETAHLPATPAHLVAALVTLAAAPLANRYFDQPVRRWLTRQAEMPRRAVTAARPL